MYTVETRDVTINKGSKRQERKVLCNVPKKILRDGARSEDIRRICLRLKAQMEQKQKNLMELPDKSHGKNQSSKIEISRWKMVNGRSGKR